MEVMKNFRVLLVVLTVFSIMVNFILLAGFEPGVHRFGRVLTTFIFLGLFCRYYHSKKILLLGALLLLFIADLFALTYQKPISQQVFFAAHALAYLLMIFHTGRYVLKQKLRSYQIGYTTIVFFLNSSFIIILGDLLAEEVNDQMVQNLFYVYGFSTILFISVAILYYDRFPNNLSTSYVFAVAGLVVSNLMGFPAHFMEFSEFFYLDRMFYVLGIAGLVSYSFYTGEALDPDKSESYQDLLQFKAFLTGEPGDDTKDQDFL